MVLTRRPILARQDSGDTSQGQPCMGTRKRCVVEKNQPPLFWGMADSHPSSLDHWHSTDCAFWQLWRHFRFLKRS